MEYAYKPTTHGRAVMAACMALQKPVKIGRVAFGSGRVADDVNLADMHELLSYVSDGAVSDRWHENDRFYMTIQYANQAHPDIKMFLLTEFIIYTEDPVTGKETDLIYGSLYDYRQPVPAYNPAFPPSVFNFPLVLIISDEISVNVAAPAGLVTYKELLEAVERVKSRREEAAAPTTGWVASEGEYSVCVDVAVDGVTEAMTPVVTILPEDRSAALACGLAPHAQTLAGAVRLWAKTAPETPIRFSLALISDPPPMGVLQEEESGAILDPRKFVRKDEIRPIPSSVIRDLFTEREEV